MIAIIRFHSNETKKGTKQEYEKLPLIYSEHDQLIYAKNKYVKVLQHLEYLEVYKCLEF